MICGPLFLKIISIGRDHLSAIALKTELSCCTLTTLSRSNLAEFKLKVEITQDLSLNFCKKKTLDS